MNTTMVPEDLTTEVMEMFEVVVAAGKAHNEWVASRVGCKGMDKWLERRAFSRECEEYRRDNG